MAEEDLVKSKTRKLHGLLVSPTKRPHMLPRRMTEEDLVKRHLAKRAPGRRRWLTCLMRTSKPGRTRLLPKRVEMPLLMLKEEDLVRRHMAKRAPGRRRWLTC